MRAIKRSQKILCISESTARDVIQFGGKDLAPKVLVTHLAAADMFKPIDDALEQLQKKYAWLSSIVHKKRLFLFVGARTSYKRFDLAVKATEGYADGHLMVIGGGDVSKLDAALMEKLVQQERVSLLPSVSVAELPLWYNAASALFYLSEYEGFGLPVLEAAQCRCPVLVQNTSSIPEVYGDHAFLLPQGTSVPAVIAVLKAVENTQVRSKLIDACVSHAEKFSWDRCWEETFEVYKSI